MGRAPTPLLAGVAAASIGLAILATSFLAGRRDSAYGDGLIYRYVASHLDARPSELDPVVTERGASLRYGRIGLPLVIWLISGGQAAAMPFAQALIGILACGAAGAALAVLFPGLGPRAGPLMAFVPGFTLAVSGGFAEAMAVALVLWAVVAALHSRWWVCAGIMAAAILTRENAALISAGCGFVALGRREWRALPILATSALPVMTWYLVVQGRFGHIPPLDPYLRVETTTIGSPGVALIASIADAYSVGALMILLVHVALAGWALSMSRRTAVTTAFAPVTVQMLIAGPFAWRFLGEATRTAVFIQLAALIALIATRMTPNET